MSPRDIDEKRRRNKKTDMSSSMDHTAISGISGILKKDQPVTASHRAEVNRSTNYLPKKRVVQSSSDEEDPRHNGMPEHNISDILDKR